MSLLEFIGFIVSMATLLFLGYRKAQDERKRRNNPEEYEREQNEREDKLKKFIRSLEGDMDEDERDREEEDDDEDEYEEEEEEFVKHVPPPPVQPQQSAAAKPLLPQAPLKPVSKAGDNFGFKPKLAEYKMASKMDEHHLTSKLDWRYQQQSESEAYKFSDETKAYDIKKSNEISVAKELLIKLPTKRNMVILHEILGLPKGLR